MPATVYALLVGINDYQSSSISSLEGCVADTQAMEAFLKSRVGANGQELSLKVLLNEQATYQAIIDQFGEHLGQAGPEDTAFFYYAGHGSQEPTAPEFEHLEPDGLDETLVCYDSRTEGVFDLADKELYQLIGQIGRNNPHILVILDSCHSGSATRDELLSREIPRDERKRRHYFFESDQYVGSRGDVSTRSGWMSPMQSKHILLAACQADQTAKECHFSAGQRGVFSYYLMETLQVANSRWTYRDLFARINSRVLDLNLQQAPVMESEDPTDLDQPFLGGAVREMEPFFRLEFKARDGWVMDGGLFHGIQPLQDGETSLAVYAEDAEDFEATDQAIGTAVVRERNATSSKVEFSMTDGSEPDVDMIYKAVLTAQPNRTGVKLDGDTDAVQRVRDALASHSRGGPSLYLEEVSEGEALRLLAKDDSYRLSRADDDRELATVVEGWAPENAREAVDQLEHMERWVRLANLHNPGGSLGAGSVSVECFVPGTDENGQEIDVPLRGKGVRLDHKYENNQWIVPRIKYKVTNNSSRELYFMLFNLNDSFEISPCLLPRENGTWLKPGKSAWAFDGRWLSAVFPDSLWQAGLAELRDLMKVVASTEPCDSTRFRQGKLGVQFERPEKGDGGTRHMMVVEDDTAPAWTTAEVVVSTYKNKGVAVPPAGEQVELEAQVTLSGHSDFEANVRIDAAPLNASRSIDGMRALPKWLTEDSDTVKPFNLSPTRSSGAGESFLELQNVSGFEKVTPDNPLTLGLGSRFAMEPGEHLLTVGYDRESDLFLPLGHATGTEKGVAVRLERLPAPIFKGDRSLGGSIKIFFKKIVSEKLGREFHYPILRAADDRGNYIEESSEALLERVKASEKVLLYIHGIIGDTSTMVKSAAVPHPGLAQAPLGQNYDLVLAFDYENLNTPIEENAQLLKKQLASIGLDSNHGRSLHIVAHSMGGLVSRYFIEYLGGKDVVQHLVMLGTPNGGSPWSSVENWAMTAIGLGLNGLGSVFWPAEVLGSLIEKFEEAAGVSLEQMNPGSPLLNQLAGSPDPGIPYSVIAGDTSLPADAPDAEKSEKQSRIFSLVKKLHPQNLLHATASLAFFKESNDVAASVASIGGVPDGFEKLDPLRKVACDHMTYFVTDEGLSALNDALFRRGS